MNLRKAAQQALVDMACMRDMVADPDNLQFIDNAITTLRTALAEPEQEPVAWQGVHDTTDLYWRKPMQGDVRPLYTHPPQRKPHGGGEQTGPVSAAPTRCDRCGKDNPAELHTCTPLAWRLIEEMQEQAERDTALLRQALEALELNLGYGPEKTIEQTHSVITTLRERLGEKT